MRQAILCGYYGMGNGGDEALLAALLQMLPKTVKPLVLSAQPRATEKLHQVEAVDRKSVWSILQAFKQSEIFIWGGGSLMQDATSARNPFYYGGLLGLAGGMGLQTIAWAQGVGPLRYASSQWITQRAFSRCDRISVRDSKSAKLLSDWDINCLMAPDPVWALASEPVAQMWDLPAPRIAVSLRSHPQLTPERISCLIEALRQLQQATNAYFLLVPFQPSKDKSIAEQIHLALPQASKVMTETNPRSLKGIFRGVEMAITMRYHGMIMSAAEGCRCSSISYDPKMSTLMAELDLPGWELNHLPNDPQEISQTWLEYFANGEPLSQDRLSSLVDRALIHQQLLTGDAN